MKLGTNRVSLCSSLLAVFAFCAVVVSFIFPSTAHAVSWTVRTQPTKPVNGSPVLFQVKPPVRLQSLTGTWLGHEVAFSFDATTKSWFGFAGVSLETPPGTYTLQLTGARPSPKVSDNKVTFARTFAVARGKYPRIKVALTVEGKFTEPTPEQLQQIDEDKKVKQDYLNRVTSERQWTGNFNPPAEAAISDVFGSQRVFNNTASRPHQGLDFRVPAGTSVKAMNSGTVLLARPLYYEGNFVVLDHGQGLLTMYMHLSAINVKEGDHVDRGQEIGLSGGTGRATGPHLHVGVRWQGMNLDPARLLQLRLP